MNTWYVVELEDDCWLAEWSGDPGRTTRVESAKLFDSSFAAALELTHAREYRPFVNARVYSLNTEQMQERNRATWPSDAIRREILGLG